MKLILSFLKKLQEFIILCLILSGCSKDRSQPSITTDAVSITTEYSAVCGGSLTSQGGSPVISRGICWNTSENPTITDSYKADSSGTESFSVEITGLLPGSRYYIRAYATNNNGTAYGNEQSFMTTNGITDFDGNQYGTAQIGEQTWMTENLKTTHYSDGKALVNGTGAGVISYQDTARYWFVYNDDPANKNIYGLLYTWRTATNATAGSSHNPSGIPGVCPSGWHLPSDDEWMQLEIFLGMNSSDAAGFGYRGLQTGGKMKETGTGHWNSPNTGANNSSEFSALPGGQRTDNAFSNLNSFGYWWTATPYDTITSYYRALRFDGAQSGRNYYYSYYAKSVRCVMN
ncbi:MAG: fibrobacter succinogenes major paralogous domain-containing protein [Bacteroidia bacterium]|nr:fibrobacter succinogenes major paralogous domain-containing protein [Bacteroidia bacterium]